MRVLDLYCGAGGAARGLLDAGFEEVVGFDTDPRCEAAYPGYFVCADVLDLAPEDLDGYDLVWASPPCQRFSSVTPRSKRDKHPDLTQPTRDTLEVARLLFGALTVIENVPRAPIRSDLTLTGPMVGLDRICRQRSFELGGWMTMQPPVQRPPKAMWLAGRALTITTSMSCPSHYYARKRAGLSGRVSKREAMEAMGIPQDAPMTCKQIGEAVPPPYAQWIGERAIERLTTRTPGPRPASEAPGSMIRR